ncbi:DUF1934 domain-containing protein [Lacticigenium naphthae]|uniref:DUF1934 domain-containing protein n=1 Tax=Lacticigenium naphthae TaxID=515351 RepID=UPI000407D1B9|nr:DUF1934 domain-containing protein [Lacticigenium naphthae]
MISSNLKNGLPAEIHMETTLFQNDEQQHHQFSEPGRVVEMNGSYYIRYEEKHEEQSIPVTIKVEADGIVSLIRRGEMTTRLRFDRDKVTQTQYKTPVGILPVDIQTTNVKISYYDRPFSGRVYVDYSLHMSEQKLGDYHLRLRFTT